MDPVEPSSREVELEQLPLSTLADEVLDDVLPDFFETTAGSEFNVLVAGQQNMCWGRLLSANNTVCTPDYVVGRGHFKNKFCPTCRACGFSVPASRLRALHTSHHEAFQNGMGSGLWTEHKESSVRFRLVNQTLKCSGPRIIILHHASVPPPAGMLRVHVHGSQRLLGGRAMP